VKIHRCFHNLLIDFAEKHLPTMIADLRPLKSQMQ